MNRTIKTLICIMAAAVLLLGAAVLAADTEPGSEDDPLISLSYLEQDFAAFIKGLFRQELDAKTEALRTEMNEKLTLLEEQQLDVLQRAESGSFRRVSLNAGDSVALREGAELILRSGTVSASPSLVLLDEVGSEGTLTKNCLYVILEGGSLTASEASVLLLRQSFG